jgi:hypothetical protein
MATHGGWSGTRLGRMGANTSRASRRRAGATAGGGEMGTGAGRWGLTSLSSWVMCSWARSWIDMAEQQRFEDGTGFGVLQKMELDGRCGMDSSERWG